MRTEKPVIHISLNPHPDDRLTDGELTQIAHEYMQRMGYGDQPYIIVKHEDIDRHHLHIVSVRVDEQGKRIGGLSRSNVGELKGWGSDFFVSKRYSYYYICDAKGKTLKTMNVSDVGEIVGVSNSTITSRKGSWIFTWSKEGKKISARSGH